MRGKINYSNLSDSLKEHLNSLRLTEEQVNELIENTLVEINEKDNENTRSTLAGLMQEGGYDITGDEDIDSLLDLLTISGISVSEIKQVSCGQFHTFILKNDGSVYSCGYNEYGQLGLGDTTDRSTFTQVTTNISDVKQISCGQYHTFILKNDGSIWSCGDNYYGQLGLGIKTTTARTTFTQVTTNIDNDVKQIACGYIHTFILKNDGSVWGCGRNGYGELGLGDTDDKTTFIKVTTNINNDVKQVACGGYCTFILKNDGSLWGCGDNEYGQLGLGTNTTQRTTFTQVTTNIDNDVKQIACGYIHAFILKNDGSVWSCGNNSTGQLGLNDTTDRNIFTQINSNINNDVKEVICGNQHTIILKNDGSVWSCGYNYYGQLGIGDITQRNTFIKITTNINNDTKQIACGGYCTFILKNDGSVWGCGYNGSGRLGLANSDNKLSFTIIPRGL